jgi:toxin ParE1/3/4
LAPNVTLRPIAVRELYDQALYYEDRGSSETALRWLDQARATFEFLARNPQIGAKWPVPHRAHRLSGVRTWPVDGFKDFIVFYRPVPFGIEVIHVLRGSRDLDRIL